MPGTITVTITVTGATEAQANALKTALTNMPQLSAATITVNYQATV